MYALEPLLKFQSTIPYLKLPPVGYLYPPIDFEAGVAEILANVENGKYESEQGLGKPVVNASDHGQANTTSKMTFQLFLSLPEMGI